MDDVVERVARALSEEGGACDWEHAMQCAKAAIRAVLEGLEQDLALTELANIEGASDEWLEGFRFAVSRLSALKEVVG